MKHWFYQHWGELVFLLILIPIIITNFHPGKLVLGNDNFTPEVNPALILTRALFNPAWRTYRALGLPSDSEQADLYRAIFYWILRPVVPGWLTSQIYYLVSLVIGCFSLGKLAQRLTRNQSYSQIVFLICATGYLGTLLTIWIYFYPVHLFVAAYAFLPFLLWRLAEYYCQPSRSNKILILVATVLLSTSALTATMFFTGSILLFLFTVSFYSLFRPSFKTIFIGLLITFLPHLFWLPTFALYAHTNSDDLQNSAINREITATTTTNETKYNTAINTLRYYFPWLDIREDGVNYTYPYRDVYAQNQIFIFLEFLPVVLALIGVIIAVYRKNIPLIILGVTAFLGWLFIKGNNPPLSQFFVWAELNIPLFKQVFRWSSSKFWPLLALPIPILIASLVPKTKASSAGRKSLIYFFSFLLILTSMITVFPFYKGLLTRPEMFVQIPTEYSELNQFLKTNDPNSRIFVTPEANTRYFRSYTWGFWGSALIHYLIPNPVIEKALIIGSNESQSAYYQLVEALYSQDPLLLAQTLNYYDTPFILLDRSVDDSRLGRNYSYTFNWPLYEQMIANNPNFSPIWHSGSLTLYRNTVPLSQTAAATHPATGNQPFNLNYNFGSNQGSYNLISLLSQTASFDDKFLTSKLRLDPSVPAYNLAYTPDQLLSAPISFTATPSALSLIPTLPYLDQFASASALPRIEIPLNSPAAYFAINQDLLPVNQTITLPLTLNQLLLASLKLFSPQVQTIPLTSLFTGKFTNDCANEPHSKDSLVLTTENLSFPLASPGPTCLSTDFTFAHDSVLNLDFTIKSQNQTLPATLCLHSLKENRCLNQNRSFYVSSTPQTIKLRVDRLISAEDNLVFYFTFPENPKSPDTITITHPQISISDQSQDLLPPQLPNITTQTITIPYQPGPLTIKYPLISSPSSLNLTDSTAPNLMLEPYYGNCPNSYSELYPRLSADQSLQFKSQDCYDGVYTYLRNLDPTWSPGLLIFAQSQNQTGIPLEIRLKPKGATRNYFADYLPAIPASTYFNTTRLPADTKDYLIEVNSHGIGSVPSQNTLNQFIVQPIPQSWLDLEIVPQNFIAPKTILPLNPFTRIDTATYYGPISDLQGLYALPTATSPYWKAVTVNAKPAHLISFYWSLLTRKGLPPTTINHWRQAWALPNTPDTYLIAAFWPNLIAYTGLTLGLGIALILAIMPVPAHKSKQTAVVHKDALPA